MTSNPQNIVLATKLARIQTLSAQVPRQHILERINHASYARLIILHAPAGFGKTTTMCQYRAQLQQQHINTIWLTLDNSDNDPARFLNCLDLAIAQSTPHKKPTLAQLTIQQQQADSNYQDLITRLSALSEPLTIFFDEFEHVYEPTVLGLIDTIINHLPEQGTIVIGSRNSPGLKLGRLRAQGQLLEIDTDLLRFSKNETKHFLSQHHELAETDINHLHDKTEGWIVALRLASMNLEKHDNIMAFMNRFSGTDGTIAEYLAEDVLAGQPQSIREFLIKTSLLQHLTAPICDAILGTSDSASLLKKVDRENLFLFPNNDKEGTYRYHSLFASFLRGQLARQFPSQLLPLHQAASQWYEDHGRPVPAIQHALDGKDYQRTVNLIVNNGEKLLNNGRMHLLISWLSELPAECFDKQPLLQIYKLWATLFSTKPQTSLDILEALESSHPAAAISDKLRGLRLLLLLMIDRKEEAYRIGKSAPLPQLSCRSFIGAMQTNVMAYTHALMGKNGKAKQLLDISRAKQPEDGGFFSLLYSEAIEAMMELDEGRFCQAKARLHMAVKLVDTELYSSSNAFVSIFYADSLYEANEIDKADQLFQFYLPMTKTIGMVDHMITGFIRLSRIAYLNGNVEQAFEYLIELEQTGQLQNIPRAIACAKLERARVYRLQGNSQDAYDELQRANDHAIWTRTETMRMPAHNIIYWHLAKLQWLAHFGDPATTLIEINTAISAASRAARHYRALNLYLLKSLVQYQSGNHEGGLQTLHNTLKTTYHEGYFRLIIDEGPTMGQLLNQLMEQNRTDERFYTDPDFHHYLQRLIQAFGPSINSGKDQPAALNPLDSLTSAETRVLSLLSQGHSNQQLADQLFVSESTVRTHLRNINKKLHSKNRTEATAIARQLGLQH